MRRARIILFTMVACMTLCAGCSSLRLTSEPRPATESLPWTGGEPEEKDYSEAYPEAWAIASMLQWLRCIK